MLLRRWGTLTSEQCEPYYAMEKEDVKRFDREMRAVNPSYVDYYYYCYCYIEYNNIYLVLLLMIGYNCIFHSFSNISLSFFITDRITDEELARLRTAKAQHTDSKVSLSLFILFSTHL